MGTIKEGHTAIVAKMIAKKVKADTLKMKAKKSNPTSFNALFNGAQKEKDRNARPAYVGDVKNWSSYDTINLGYPLWYDDMPMIMYHLFESHNLKNKTMYPFDTSGSEGFLNTVSAIKKKTKGATVKSVFTIPGETAQNDRAKTRKEVYKWLS